MLGYNKQKPIIKKNPNYVRIKRVASLGDGIVSLEEEDLESYKRIAINRKLVRFFPSSGAGTRMFSFDSLSHFGEEEKHILLKKVPLFSEIEIDQEKSFEEIIDQVSISKSEYGVSYKDLPKILLPFHKYKDVVESPLDAHVWVTEKYFSPATECHFTIDEKFKEHIEKKVEKLSIQTHIGVNISEQSSEFETFLIDDAGIPVKGKDRNFITNPGGHGALLDNLNKISADIINIQNIDNISRREFQQEVVSYSQKIIGRLIRIQSQIFEFLRCFDLPVCSENTIKKAKDMVENVFGINIKNSSNQILLIEEMKDILDRPIRICGVIKSSLSRTGGYPFWVESEDGSDRLQIVEHCEIDIADEDQKKFLEESKHFNPVILACGIKNYNGKKYDLNNYTNQKRWLVYKRETPQGAFTNIEYPGLWNGSMDGWLTLFADLPESIFSPVKNILDFTSPLHQV